MDVKLVSLLAVIETGSLCGAASKLMFTQPAVSHHIKQLESEYGFRIFVKNGKNMQLTSAGKVLAEYAQEAKKLEKSFDVQLKELRNEPCHFSIGASVTTAENILPIILSEYCKRYPQITVDITCDSRGNLIRKLHEFELDWIIINPYEDTTLPEFPFCRDKSLVFVSAKHRYAHRKTITLSELKQEKMILCYKHNPAMRKLDDEMQKIGSTMDEMNVIIETNSMVVIKKLVEKDVGVSVLQESACIEEIQEGKLVPLEIEGLEMDKSINIICRKGFEYTYMFDELKQIYEEKMKDSASL